MSTLLRLAGSMICGPLMVGFELWGENEIGFGADVGLIVGEVEWRVDRVRSFNWFRKSHDRDKLQRVLSPVLIPISTQTRDSRVIPRISLPEAVTLRYRYTDDRRDTQKSTRADYSKPRQRLI